MSDRLFHLLMLAAMFLWVALFTTPECPSRHFEGPSLTFEALDHTLHGAWESATRRDDQLVLRF